MRMCRRGSEVALAAHTWPAALSRPLTERGMLLAATERGMLLAAAQCADELFVGIASEGAYVNGTRMRAASPSVSATVRVGRKRSSCCTYLREGRAEKKTIRRDDGSHFDATKFAELVRMRTTSVKRLGDISTLPWLSIRPPYSATPRCPMQGLGLSRLIQSIDQAEFVSLGHGTSFGVA